jgi:ATP phosphoribosyltransferase regulatory subunit
VERYVSFDLGLLSKYHYYTGVIFKAYTYGVGDAVAKGGRYDNLLKYFGKEAPAIGFVIVVDDLLEALARQKKVPRLRADGVLIIYEEGRFRDALKKAKELRAQQIPAELIPAIPGTGSSDTGSFEKNVKIYREKSKNHMQKAFYYMPAEGGCMEELLDRN